MKTSQEIWRCDWKSPIMDSDDGEGLPFDLEQCGERVVIEDGDQPANWMVRKHRQAPHEVYCPQHAAAIEANRLLR